MFEVGKPWSPIILIRSEGCPGMGTERIAPNEESALKREGSAGKEKGAVGEWCM